MNVDNPKTINILSLCTGYGGLELGLARALAGVFRVVAVEVEAYALANLAAKAQEGKLAIEAMWPDLKTFPAERFRGCFDFVLAGYPCQPFSVAGKRKGADDPRHLWPHIARIVQAVRPVWCFFENVPGHLTIGFPEVYRSLRDMGYSVEAGIFSAAEVGAPHKRERLFILAHASRLRCNTGRTTESLQGIGEYGVTLQLADTGQHDGQRLQQKEQPKELPKELSGGNQLADTECPEPGQGTIKKTQAGSGWDRFAIDRWPSRPGQPQYEWEEPRVVANSQQRCRRRQDGDSQRLQCEIQTEGPGKGQVQSRLGRELDGNTIALDIAKGIRGGYYVKPGGEIGHDLVMEAKMRVDRLRLLGNGVSPWQAEKAFRELMRLFDDS
ncbi:MAG: DNA cytosine methyltransferase [Methylococcaceae bacterium]